MYSIIHLLAAVSCCTTCILAAGINSTSNAHAGNSSSAYQAPYITVDPNCVNQNVYTVKLAKNHSLEAHFNFIGTNLSAEAERLKLMKKINTYIIECNEDLIHNSIRSDPGVVRVAQDSFSSLYDHLNAPNNGSAVNSTSKRSLLDEDLLKRWGATDDSASVFNTAYFRTLSTNHIVGSSTGPYESLDLAGTDVNVYVLDTGINIEHVEFQSVVPNAPVRAINYRGETSTSYTTPKGLDPNHSGIVDQTVRCHGTYMASAAAGKTMGLARNAQIINIRIFNDKGLITWSDVADAITDVVDDHDNNKAGGAEDFRGSVINLSIASYDVGSFDTVYDAIESARDSNIPVMIAAGNYGKDSSSGPKNAGIYPCTFSIDNNYGSALGNVWCMGNMDTNYVITSDSNYGNAVMASAPASTIVGADCDANTGGIIFGGGTSGATAFSSGLAATYLGYLGPATNFMDLNMVIAQNGIPNALNTNKVGSTLVLTNGIDSPVRYRGPFAWAPNGPQYWEQDFPDFWLGL